MTGELVGMTPDDLKVFEAQELVRRTNDPDDLASIVTEDQHHWVARNDAAEKLIEMFLAGDMRCDLNHLAIVGDHADEPHKSEANSIIRHHP